MRVACHSPAMTRLSWLCRSQSASSHCARRRVKWMRPGSSSGFFHTACVEFWFVSTSVLLCYFLATMASLSVAPLDSVLPASGEAVRLILHKLPKAGREEAWCSVVVNGHLKWHCHCRQCRFRWLGRLGDQPTKLKDVQGLVQIFQAFMFGAIEEDVLT